MSDYYHHFLSSMTGVGAQPPNANFNPQDAPLPLQQPPAMSHPGVPPNPYQSLGYFTGFPEPIMFNAPKSQRSRRKSAPGLDHIKHRRTRSGCYTCRSRRVKCDETRPVCERCRKGKRECIYPEPPAQKGASSGSSKDGTGPSQHTSPTSSIGDDDDDMDQDQKLEPILDEDEVDSEGPSQHSTRPLRPPRRSSTTSSFGLQLAPFSTRHGSETPSFDGNKSSSPSASTGTGSSFTPAALQFSDFSWQTTSFPPDWSALPQEIQFYLNYFCENITHYHYCMITDSADFFRLILPSIALRHEALLYAVVGFAAYHHTLKNPNGQINEFLQYYNKSVTLLLGFLKKKEKHNIGTLLTILQLAAIEEYLGDWVNLMGHQRAAFEVINELFTPLSAMQTSTSRTILTWYVRFDIFVGIMGNFETALPREWFSTAVDFYLAQADSEPDNVMWKTEERSARLRLISMEMSILYGKGARGALAGDHYLAEHRRLSQELQNWKDSWDPAMTDPALLVTDFSANELLTSDDAVRSFTPGILYHPPLFASTLLTCEWRSIVIMHGSQAIMDVNAESQLAMLGEHAYAICQIFETVERWPSTPKGSLISIHACLAIATLFLPRDPKHHSWIRRKFALLESMGYIFPLTMRMRMAELFGDQSCVRWWLADDEGFTEILKNVRIFADERNATAVTAQSENLRQIRHIFSRLQLGGLSDSPQSDDAVQAERKGR
ncbi:hypothetical protein CONLIGDRAFT_267885 [Coniochaeta ligniaria NRRL 30616]|uniref:Zn(2)-C6 fungal-type domain-containing protein n=1 Tax=Coniochaeta ligniaria NRRL 30616 TaxID=1408157 RepID=A0A1J7JR24_9PEZI|nr:hypothetical protein CONLIGDRAFT_267885 [Coniochaeta ligniaria NRRL 30616]